MNINVYCICRANVLSPIPSGQNMPQMCLPKCAPSNLCVVLQCSVQVFAKSASAINDQLAYYMCYVLYNKIIQTTKREFKCTMYETILENPILVLSKFTN